MTFATHGMPLLFVAMLWFASTALVVWLDNRPADGFARSLRLAGIVTLVAGGVTFALRNDSSLTGAYAGFSAALVIWGWHEMSFLMGKVTGPRRTPCPPDAHGWTRFRLSAATVIHHELALAVTLAALIGICWTAANTTAAWTFGILFTMRLSTKLNVFLGVPNFSVDILPKHLAYLKSYFREARFNALMPVSLVLGTALTIWLAGNALAVEGDTAVQWSLLTAIALLGVLEHLFLILPLGDSALWRWAKPAAPQI
jgi:putative photosynthetic complex assembly protein 2